MSSNELFYRQSKNDNKKADAELHEPILDTPHADETVKTATIERSRAKGLSEEALTLLYL